MHVIPRWFAGLMLLTGMATAPVHAETFDTCTGFIDSLPATISTQGNWCLRKDLATAITTGDAILVTTNNVTIDCNSFKIGGLAAGPGSLARGIRAVNRLNVTVRQCTVRGFHVGVTLFGGGHLVEDNRLEQNLYQAVYLQGEGNIVRRNQALDTGGATGGTSAAAFYVQGDVIDNTIAGVYTDAPGNGTGMYAYGDGNEISGNRIRGLVGNGVAIAAAGAAMTVRDNAISIEGPVPNTAISGGGAATACIGNTVVGYDVAYSSCQADIDNLDL
ncbi:MAG TPA: right-handed parallel beta-helix repeat-containing protein [Lysobacter sp.]